MSWILLFFLFNLQNKAVFTKSVTFLKHYNHASYKYYRIWLYYRTYSHKRTVKQFRRLQIAVHVISAITKTCLFKYIENFTSKNWKFSDLKKKNDIFHISAQNIDCGYLLVLPQWGCSNEYPQYSFWVKIRKIMYTPVNPSLLYKSGV